MDIDETPKTANALINIIIAEALCVCIILLSVFVLKYFFKWDYSKLRVWYEKEICVGTDINEVTK